MRHLIAALLLLAAAALLGTTCSDPPKHYVYVEAGDYCADPYELELPPNHFRGPAYLTGGLIVGDCVELPAEIVTRLCCPTPPRTCGSNSRSIPPPVCKRMVTL